MEADSSVGAQRPDLVLRTFLLAIVFGITGDLMVHDLRWGLGFSTFAGLLALGGVYLYRKGSLPVSRQVQWLVVPVLAFAACFSWRDAIELKILDALCLMLLIGLMTLRARWSDIRIGTLGEYPFELLGQWARFVVDAFPLADLEGGWSRFGRDKTGKAAGGVLRGLLLVLPLILVFGGLFMSADAGFERLVSNVFKFNPENAASHSVLVLIYTCLVGGCFRRLFLVRAHDAEATVPKPPPLGIVEIATALVTLNLLFGLFVATQFRHFFGGNEVVMNTQGLGFGDYARRGFFELATIALLSLPVLLGSHALFRRDAPSASRIYGGLAGALVVLLFAVIGSAWLRMRIYVDAYGISQLRLYVFAAIAWIGAVFAWFAATVLRGRPERFAFGGLTLFLGGVFALNVINPDGMVAKINTSRHGRSIDVGYLGGLSADAVPALVSALDSLRAEERLKLEGFLYQQREDLQLRDPRSWDLGAESARAALAPLSLRPPLEPQAERESQDNEETVSD